MAHDVIRRLSKIPNLIYISANRFVPGWEGDFKKKRPSNISITHAYSDLFVNSLQKFAKIIDLRVWRSEEHTSELQSLMRISYAVFCLKKKKQNIHNQNRTYKHQQTQ